MEPIVSVIIPVYNSERYLRECLDSLLKQTMKDFEVLCVDDGSTDSSVRIVTEYTDHDSRFRLIRQENQSAGAARNHGIRLARGEYLICLDSDDRFDPGLLEKAVSRAEDTQADVVIFGFHRFDSNTGRVLTHDRGFHPDAVPEQTEFFNWRACPDRICSLAVPVPWNKLYRTAFIRDNRFAYDEIPSCNDVTFAALTVTAADRIAILDEELVAYRNGNSGSISSGKNKTLNNAYLAVSSFLRQAEALPMAQEIHGSAISFSVEFLMIALKRYVGRFSDPATRDFYQHVHELFQKPEIAEPMKSIRLESPEHQRLYRVAKKKTYEEMLRWDKRHRLLKPVLRCTSAVRRRFVSVLRTLKKRSGRR